MATVQSALEMIELSAMFNAEHAASGKAPIALGIGIASGEVTAGHAGTPRRASYVVVGAAVQRAAALEALTMQHARSVLIDGATNVALSKRAPTEGLPSATLPGSATAMPVYALKAT